MDKINYAVNNLQSIIGNQAILIGQLASDSAEKDKIIAQLRAEAKHEFTDTNAGSSQDHSIYATDTDDPAK